MALSQEFWLQQRRREAKQSAAGAADNGAARIVGTVLNGDLPVTTLAAWPVPHRLELQPGLELEARKDWNSDDESTDEFGRKKRTRSTTCREMSRAQAKAPQLQRDTETDRQVGRKGKLTAKQQAALDRLKSRCSKPQAPGSKSLEEKQPKNFQVLPLHGPPPPPAHPPSQAFLPPPPPVRELPVAPWLAAWGSVGSGQAIWQAAPTGGAGMVRQSEHGADFDLLGQHARSRSPARRTQPM